MGTLAKGDVFLCNLADSYDCVASWILQRMSCGDVAGDGSGAG